MARPVQTKKTTVNRRLIAGVTLLVAIILTVVFLWLGVTGRNMDSQGLYKLLPWLPVPTQGTLWRQALVPGAGLGDTLTLTLTPETAAPSDTATETETAETTETEPAVAAGFDPAALEESAEVIARRLSDMGWTDSSAVVLGGGIVATLPGGADEASLRTILTTPGEFAFADATGAVFLTGDHLTEAGYGYADNTGNNFGINFSLDAQGKEIFEQKAQELFGQEIQFLRDGAMVISSTFTGLQADGSLLVDNFTLSQAQENTLLLRSGALPAALAVQSDGVAGTALLGSSAQTALIYALIAVLFVASFYLVARFRLAGAVAVWMLVLQVALSYFFAALIGSGFTLLTLVGVWVPFLVSFFAFVNLLGAAQADLRRGRSIRQALKDAHAGRGHASLDAFALLVLACVVLIIMDRGVMRIFSEVFALGLLLGLVLTHLAARVLWNETIHLIGGETRLYTSAVPAKKEA